MYTACTCTMKESKETSHESEDLHHRRVGKNSRASWLAIRQSRMTGLSLDLSLETAGMLVSDKVY